MEAAIERIERLNPRLNAVVTPLFEQARAAVAGTTPSGPFAGVPYLLKDLVVEIEGTPFHEGSVFLRDNVSTSTSELVHRLRQAGLVMLGRPRTPGGDLGHPDCVRALDDAVALCAELGHDLVEADLPGLDEAAGAAIGTVFHAATAWVVAYWVRHRGREPEPDELDPLTRAYREAGVCVTAADYLLAIGDLQRFARTVAEFLTGVDLWLTPTMSAPPARIGELTSTPGEPLRALERGAPTLAYPLVVANITGNPAMSVPLAHAPDGMPTGVHFLGRFGAEATLFRLAAQLEQARPWAGRTPPVHAWR